MDEQQLLRAYPPQQCRGLDKQLLVPQHFPLRVQVLALALGELFEARHREVMSQI
jgi:hypothetical protein